MSGNAVERRVIERIRVATPCWVVLANDQPVFLAETVDISVDGARVRLAKAAVLSLDTTITIFFGGPSTVPVRCKLVWQRQDEIGVSFIEAPIKHDGVARQKPSRAFRGCVTQPDIPAAGARR